MRDQCGYQKYSGLISGLRALVSSTVNCPLVLLPLRFGERRLCSYNNGDHASWVYMNPAVRLATPEVRDRSNSRSSVFHLLCIKVVSERQPSKSDTITWSYVLLQQGFSLDWRWESDYSFYVTLVSLIQGLMELLPALVLSDPFSHR